MIYEAQRLLNKELKQGNHRKSKIKKFFLQLFYVKFMNHISGICLFCLVKVAHEHTDNY